MLDESQLDQWHRNGFVNMGPLFDAPELEATAADVLLFSSLLVHQTVGNTTDDRQRRAWVIQYCRGDQHNEVTGEEYDNRGGSFAAAFPCGS